MTISLKVQIVNKIKKEWNIKREVTKYFQNALEAKSSNVHVSNTDATARPAANQRRRVDGLCTEMHLRRAVIFGNYPHKI